VLLVAVTAAACSRSASPPPRVPPPLPQVSGELRVAALSQPVRVVRDRWGIPHIRAQNTHDLFVAQGFVQAQDRLFQMDLWRRSVQGRLAEVLGPNFIDRDAMTRRMQYRGDAAADWAAYGPGVKPIAEAFVAGINAWIDIATQNLPDEFALAGWRPEPWRADDLLNRTDAFLASGDADIEAFRAELIAAVGEQQADRLVPSASPGKTRRRAELDNAGAILIDALRRIGTTPFFSGFASPFAGSNAWAIPASRSTTGRPLLANDPHRPLANPSLRYLVHLQAPGWNVIGATSPWLPGVVIGHNDHVAWGMAAYPGDTQDIYADSSVPTTIVKDPIVIKGEAKPFAFEREYTSHGAVIASDRERHLVYTLQWSGFEPGTAGELSALNVDQAGNAAGLRTALTTWRMPVVDVVYADADGLVGHQVAGLVPVRRLSNGRPEWHGWLSLDELPHVGPSKGGAVVAANEKPARVNRLREIFSGATKFTVDDVKRQQGDVTAWNAEQLVPRLSALRAQNAVDEAARVGLVNWDKRVSRDSAAASLYVFWERALWRTISERRVPAAVLDDYLSRIDIDIPDALKASDALMLEAFASAADRIKTPLSGDRRTPAWGTLHRVLFQHPLAITQASRRLYNVGPFEQDGYAATVMSSSARSGVDIGASFRHIADLSDWDRSVATSAPGQSELPRSQHFSDLAKLWAAGEYFPLVFTDGAVQSNAEATLILNPTR
jgi:penicillin amidase